MSDKRLLSDIKNALLAEGHEPNRDSSCNLCHLCGRLDSELAKVTEPVWTPPPASYQLCLPQESNPWRKVDLKLVDHGVSDNIFVLDLAEPVVLDLSGVDWIRAHRRQYFNGPDLLAAIRAQLPGVEVRV